MHTPVSKAAEGAYVVAACVTGVIAGGGSLLFQDITEGISCFLGGFCLSMWILVLRRGGTIPNTVGKILFISCLTVGTPALYISRHTRPYALIGSTSFAGATAVVLGIDCFSVAGLKEFWLYIWSRLPTFPSTLSHDTNLPLNPDINNEIFPLHYDGPYPITRGMQVEIGAMVIICAMGIMSQMKVWKIIRRRKEEKAREQRRRDMEGDAADEAHGRRIEDGIKRERGSWEAAHGGGERGKSQYLDSATGIDESSTRLGSLSNVGTPGVGRSDTEGIELQEIDASPQSINPGGRLTVHVSEDDGISPTTLANGQHLAHSAREVREPSMHESQIGASNHLGCETFLENAAADTSVDPSPAPNPIFTYLPFKVPDPGSRSEDGRSSVAASASSEHMAERWSKRLSGSSIVRQLSRKSQHSFIAASTSNEALMIPNTQSGIGSSVAATEGGVSGKDGLEEEVLSVRDPRPSFETLRKQYSKQALIQCKHASADLKKEAEESPGQCATQTALRDVNGLIDPRPESVALPDSEIASITDVRSIIEPNVESRADTAATSNTSKKNPIINSLGVHLPEGDSKVVMAYRTNEWAKHLDGAELPEIDELTTRRARAPQPLQPIEHVAPVDVRALQQTPLNAEPAPTLTIKTLNLGDRSAAYFQSKNPFHIPQDTQHLKPFVHQLTREKAVGRTPSQTSLAINRERSPSQISFNSTQSRKEQHRPRPPKLSPCRSSFPPARAFRSSSTPMVISPLVESPIKEGVEASFPTRFTPSPTHLMSQRDSMIRNKPSPTSLPQTNNWSNTTLDQYPAMQALEEDENIPLSQRRSLLLQQKPQSIPRLHRSSSGPIPSVTPPIRSRKRLSQPLPARPFPSPPPGGGPTVSAWRASLQESATTHHRDREIEDRRATLIAEKRRESSSRQEQRLSQSLTQTVKDRGMRQGSMIELHQQHIRKMQAEANRSLK